MKFFWAWVIIGAVVVAFLTVLISAEKKKADLQTCQAEVKFLKPYQAEAGAWKDLGNVTLRKIGVQGLSAAQGPEVHLSTVAIGSANMSIYGHLFCVARSTDDPKLIRSAIYVGEQGAPPITNGACGP